MQFKCSSEAIEMVVLSTSLNKNFTQKFIGSLKSRDSLKKYINFSLSRLSMANVLYNKR